MFITPAYAQAQTAPGAGGIFGMILPLILMMAVFWFLLIRPQQKKMKEHKAMLDAIRRGDTVVTSGGLVGKVTKVADDELTVEIAPELKVKVLRGYVADVRAKGQPVKPDGEGK